MIHELLENFVKKTAVSTATILNNKGSIIASNFNKIEDNKYINIFQYFKGINNAWKVIDKLAKEKGNEFDFYKDIELLSFQMDEKFNNITYSVLIKAITDKIILLTIFPNTNVANVSNVVTEFKKILKKLSNYYLDLHTHLYI
ncbi:MAG: hypothetical protein ACFFAN_17130 [Promethearchaeota archaeon]